VQYLAYYLGRKVDAERRKSATLDEDVQLAGLVSEKVEWTIAFHMLRAMGFESTKQTRDSFDKKITKTPESIGKSFVSIIAENKLVAELKNITNFSKFERINEINVVLREIGLMIEKPNRKKPDYYLIKK
jgi:hypothetical protein